MRDRMNEGVVLLALANLANEEHRVQREPANQHGKADHPDKQEQPGAPVDDDEADIEPDRDRDQSRAE